jgi:flagellar protein FlaH
MAMTGISAMTKILVAEDERDIRELVVDTLFDRGYDVLESKDRKETLQIARREDIDLIILDIMMPIMDGFEVLESLKENPLTAEIPVVMLTAIGALAGEQKAMKMGVHHYVSKPFEPDVLQATVRVALRDAGSKGLDREQSGKVWSGSSLFHSSTDGDGQSKVIPLGAQLGALQKKLEGGIRLGTLCFLEGPSATGKSLICQYVTDSALGSGHSVAYFTSQHTPRSLESQVSTIKMEWLDYIETEKLAVFPVQPPVTGKDSGPLLAELAIDMERVQRNYDVIILDAITNLASSCQEHAIISFFTTCKKLANMGVTILLVSHSVAFNADLLSRASSMCETHLNLRTGKVRDKVVRVIRVEKLDDVEIIQNNEVSFTVEPGVGIQIIPYSSAKA